METYKLSLSLRDINIRQTKFNYLRVVVTLYNRDTVVTTEHLCKNNPTILLEAAIRATLAAISDLAIADMIPPLRFLQVKQHFLEEAGKLLVLVLVEVGEGKSAKPLSVVVRASESTAVEAAVRATIKAINRIIKPHSIIPISNREHGESL